MECNFWILYQRALLPWKIWMGVPGTAVEERKGKLDPGNTEFCYKVFLARNWTTVFIAFNVSLCTRIICERAIKHLSLLNVFWWETFFTEHILNLCVGIERSQSRDTYSSNNNVRSISWEQRVHRPLGHLEEH